MHRRDFLKNSCALAAGAAALGRVGPAAGAAIDDAYVREASWYRSLPGGQVACQLCPNRCRIRTGQAGVCRVRANRGGKLVTRIYGRPVTMNDDPVEKKPLFHFLPGTTSLSISNGGCNMVCRFCQNWQLSQSPPERLPDRYGFVSADDLVAVAERKSSRSIALTYAEPVVAHEYNLAVAKAGRKAGIPALMVSNGYIELEPLDELLPELGAYKVDFKAFDEGFYRDVCQGRLRPVLRAMQRIQKRGVWLEIVHLTIPTLNDGDEQIKRLCAWVVDNLGPDVPLHFTRFHPTYRLRNLPATPPSTLERAWNIAKKAGLHYPYVGNLPGHQGENTHCHGCGQLLIKREGYRTTMEGLDEGRCTKCNTAIPGVWKWPA